MDDNTPLSNYQALIGIDAILNNLKSKYPFSLNEQSTYTQHQITLYQSNYCHTETEPTKEQPSVTGGSATDIALIDY